MKAHCSALMVDFLSGSDDAQIQCEQAKYEKCEPLIQDNWKNTGNSFKLKTSGLKTRFRSVIYSSNIISGLSSRLEAALSLNSVDKQDTESEGGKVDAKLTNSTLAGMLKYNTKSPIFGSLEGPKDSFAKFSCPINEGKIGASNTELSSTGKVAPVTGPGLVVLSVERDLSSESLGCESNISASGLKATGPDPYEKLIYKLPEPPSSESASELDGYGPSTSLDSDGTGRFKYVCYGSQGSLQSWASSLSLDSQTDETTVETIDFIKKFVDDLFSNNSSISLDRKSKFGLLAQTELGRLWFARFVNRHRVYSKKVNESTFYGLIQYFALVLFECAEFDDFSPAKSLMNMCFTFYHEDGSSKGKQFLYTFLRDQPIWQSLRFWNAAFFDALQCERAHRPVLTRDDVEHNNLQDLMDEKQFQENITFGQLGSFTANMQAFGLSKELCLDFLRKQCTIANLSQEQVGLLLESVKKFYGC